MREEDVSRIFNMEVREKKRIGSNIFKRVSTRKGGSNMSTMRVPTQKEQRLLSGEMEVFNLNEIIPYDELLKKSESDQKLLLKHWREKYSNKEIYQGMGVDSNRLYRLLKKLEIIIPNTGKKYSIRRTELSDNELEELLADKEHLYSFNEYKKLVDWQQEMLLQEYVDRYNGVVLQLSENWEGSDSGFLYHVRSKAKKNKTKTEEVPVEKSVPSDEIEVEETEVIEEPVVTNEPVIVEEQTVETGVHDVNIIMNKKEEEKENTFSFKLTGHYSKDSIIRRLNMLILELDETEDMLKIDITIEG